MKKFTCCLIAAVVLLGASVAFGASWKPEKTVTFYLYSGVSIQSYTASQSF